MNRFIILLFIPSLLFSAPIKYGTSTHYIPIQVKVANVYVADTKVPVVVGKTSLGAAIAGCSQSNGSDIVVTTEAGAAVPCTLTTFSKIDSSFQLYLQDPAQSSVTGGTQLYLQYGGTSGGQSGAAIWQNVHGGTDDYFWVVPGDTVGGKLVDISKNYTATDANITYGVSGKMGSAASFNGVNSNSNWGDITQLNSTQYFTLSFWANISAYSATGYTFIKYSTDNLVVYFTNASGGTVSASIQHVTTGDASCATVKDTGSWGYYTIIYDGTTIIPANRISINIDGINKETTPTGTVSDSTGNLLGVDFKVGYQAASLNGLLDESRFFSGILNVNQIKFQYDNQNGFSTNEVLTIGSAAAFTTVIAGRAQPFRNAVYRNDDYRLPAFRE